MKTKRCAIVAICLTACAVVGLVFALLPSPGVTKANFEWIEKGMTHADAQAIFGSPSREEYLMRAKDGSISHIRFDRGKACAWVGADGDAIVVFDEHGLLSSKTWIDHKRTFFEKVRDMLHIPR